MRCNIKQVICFGKAQNIAKTYYFVVFGEFRLGIFGDMNNS